MVALGFSGVEEEEEDDGHGHSHGEKKKPKRPKGPMYIINWTESHSHNDDAGEYFLIANNAGSSGKGSNNAIDMVAFSMPVQRKNAYPGISVTPCGITTVFNPLQPSKARETPL